MLIRHNFDNRVSYSVTKRTAEWVGCVCRRRTIQNYRSRACLQLFAHSIPFCIGSDLRNKIKLHFISLTHVVNISVRIITKDPTVTGEGETSINFPDSVELFSGGRVRENSQR